jgi:alkylation response protein AidB-like acyl-CoA dehydrogenase
MSDLQEFRQEVRTWLAENAPESLRGRPATDIEGVWGGRKWEPSHPDERVWLERMGAKGWTAPTWPAEYGGGGLSKEEAKILAEELKAISMPPALVGFGLTMIGPTLLRFGNEAQKKQHLPKIVRGEIRWCQGYSEPGSGSDLASLQTKAARDGDHFVINGTKVWTSYADQADWIFALVRSDSSGKKQEGITFILIDMDDPGVKVSPILLISGKSPFCETHFTDVRVPVENVVHEIGAGWTVAKALLGHERTMIADTFGGAGMRPRKAGERSFLPSLAVERIGEVDGRVADPIVRDQVSQIEMDSRAFALTVQRTKDAAKAGHQPGPESSMFKVYGTELNMRRYELMVRVLGPDALGWEGPGFDGFALDTTREWLRSRGNSIEGGTSEIQLNIIAKRVLGLPD